MVTWGLAYRKYQQIISIIVVICTYSLPHVAYEGCGSGCLNNLLYWMLGCTAQIHFREGRIYSFTPGVVPSLEADSAKVTPFWGQLTSND